MNDHNIALLKNPLTVPIGKSLFNSNGTERYKNKNIILNFHTILSKALPIKEKNVNV